MHTVLRRDLAIKLGYASEGGFNAALNKCDDMQMSVLYKMFEILGCELEVDLRKENDTPTNASKNMFPEDKWPIRPLLAAMTRYRKTLREIAMDLGMFERTISYYTQKGDITFSKLCDIANVEGWSLFVTVRENHVQPGGRGRKGNWLHYTLEAKNEYSLAEIAKVQPVEKETKKSTTKTK